MNTEQIKHLPDELKDRWRKLEKVFDSQGWALIEELAQQRRDDARNRQLNANTWDIALVHRGVALAYNELANLREVTEHEFAAISAANAEVEALQDEIDHE